MKSKGLTFGKTAELWGQLNAPVKSESQITD